MTMNGTWGYKSFDTNWKSTETLVRNLVDIASKGGNYLLNVGPTAEGEIPAASIERLEQIGAWMRVNSESIYATTASPFQKLTWGRCTKKLSDDGATLYLHVFDWPADGTLLVPGLKSKVTHAALLANDEAVAFQSVEDGVKLKLPASASDAIDSVVVLTISGALDVQKLLPQPDADGNLTLLVELGDLHVPPFGHHAQLEGPVGQRNIGYWTDADNWVEWPFKLDEPTSFDIFAEVATLADGVRITMTVDDDVLTATVPKTGDYKAYQRMKFGHVKIEQPGTHTLVIKPVKEDWRPINLRRVSLQRVEPVRD